MTNRRGAVADLHIADWFLPALDAVEPVLMVLGAGVKSDTVFIQRLAENFQGLGLDHAATHMDAAFLALERRTAFEFARSAAALDHSAGGIGEADIKLLRSFVEMFFIVNRRALDLHRPAIVHTERPLSDVEVMRSPVGHLTAGVIPEKAEQIMHTILVVAPQWRRAKPHIVIQLRWSFAVRHVGRIALF